MEQQHQEDLEVEQPVDAGGDLLSDHVDSGEPSIDAIAASQQQRDEPQQPSMSSSEDAPAHAPEPASHEVFNILDDELDEIEELKFDGFYDKITADDIKDLPPVARRILHNFRIDRKLASKKHHDDMGSMQTRLEQRQGRLLQQEREFARRQAEFASLIEDPDIQKLLEEPEGQLPDVFTEEGVEARIQRGIAGGLKSILSPMKVAADVKARESAYLDFTGKHPEMRNSTFKKEVVGLVRSRASEGVPISTQDAYQLVKARQLARQHQQRVAHETRARQQSARRIGRAVSGGSPSQQGVPPDVKKQGAYAIAKWLQANPEAAKTISRSVR